MAEFRDLSSGKGPGLPGSYPDSIVRIFILFGGENKKTSQTCFFTKSVKLNRTEVLVPRVDSKSRDLAIEKGFRASF